MNDERTQLADQYLAQLKNAGRGRLKIYIGMSAGVGKTYRMLQEARQMVQQGIQVVLGLVVTHGRKETEAMLENLPVIPQREVFYKGKKMTELDLNAILVLHPTWVVVDELAHSNIPGSKNPKRWQDVMDLLEAGINVITAVNIQHIDSINDEVQRITGIQVQERVPDDFLQQADEVVNIDLSAEDLIAEKYTGIRPAPGYPACPDHSVKREMFALLQCDDIGMGLTESLAMTPAASVSGFYLAHPEAVYFNVGKIGEDQVHDLAQRRGMPVAELERLLGPNL